ncbi:hypothetical protein GCM10020229_38470 [Kitasatospora albolonga]
MTGRTGPDGAAGAEGAEGRGAGGAAPPTVRKSVLSPRGAEAWALPPARGRRRALAATATGAVPVRGAAGRGPALSYAVKRSDRPGGTSRQPDGGGALWRRPIRRERSRGRSVRRCRSAVERPRRTPVQSSPVRWATEARSTRRPAESP